MRVHATRKHSENFECQLCKYDATDMENLDLHLFTCELYRCENCSFECNQLSDIKTHINNMHANKKDKRDIFLEHFKQCRNNSEEFTMTRHWSQHLFTDMRNQIYK